MTFLLQYNSRDIGPPRHPSNATISSLQAAENNGKSSSPNVINIDLDNDRSTVASSSSSGPGSHHESPSARNSRGPPSGMPSSSQPAPPPSSQASQMRSKNITFGELTDKIITNDYHPPIHIRAPPPHPTNFMPYMQDPIIATDVWKMSRRVQKEEAAHAAAAAKSSGPPSSQQQGVNSNSNPGTPNSQVGRSTTPGDDRNIIRMPQAHSPRKYLPDFMIQAQDYHYQQQQHQQQQAAASGSIMRGGSAYDSNPGPGGSAGSAGSGGSSSGGPPPVVPNHTFDTMKYVQNRIVEVMRTEDDHRAASGPANDHHDHHNDHRMKDPLEPRKTPNQYDDRDGGRRSASSDSSHSHPSSMGGAGSYQPTPVTTFAATTYAYPYSALNVPSSVAGLPPQPQMSLNVAHQMPPTSSAHKQPSHVMHGGGVGGGGVGHDGGPNSVVSTTSGGGAGGQSASEPKPLLSAQYEALSDED